MTIGEKAELFRKWGTTLTTILIVPMIGLLFDNFRMKIKAEADANYFTKSAQAEYVQEHKDWSNEQVRTLKAATQSVADQQQQASKDTEMRFNAIVAKMDAVILNLNTLQIQVGTLERTVERKQ